ncbi:DNA cytosine methyltransferase [Leucobacter chromiireducens]|uniref:DNA (cytosine-5-)-methyltransferase n=1 Tax=Leucobacter chromiireducens subsp. chromiireducens TaxID=660067 RepID=A0ABS1SSK1_9MICO|nr:DNA cytosine methyltransferase [Leucobacter chromiireducens]MBL3691121.1 DNA cytosine methyltransferase [Leucobacter chromiireducens subsp. chromiireducens]
MREDPATPADLKPLRVGSLFSGYGGLDLAVEHVFHARTMWFSEISPVQRVFAHHWQDAPNLGDITAVDWSTVSPVDILCGGFPCQDVSTVGKMAGLAPGTRSGLWAHMAEAIDQLRPGFVVIENVRGLLSAPAVRSVPDPADATPPAATLGGDDHASPAAATLRDLEPGMWGVGDESGRPFRALGAVLGDLADLGYDAAWLGLPASSVGAPHPRFRVFILARAAAPDAAGVGFVSRRGKPRSGAGEAGNDRALPSGHRPRTERARYLESAYGRIGDAVVPGRAHLRAWGRYATAIARWEHVTGMTAPVPAIHRAGQGLRPSPGFVEWLMGLPPGWVTGPGIGLTANQQLTALGNGVLPLQAVAALTTLTRIFPVATESWRPLCGSGQKR